MIHKNIDTSGKENGNVISKRINLSNYRGSKDWIGCYRRSGKFTLTSTNNMISRFIQSFTKEFIDGSILSSLTYSEDLPIDYDDEIISALFPIEKQLRAIGLITPYSENSSDESEEECIDENRSFTAFSLNDPLTIRNISLTIMANARIRGHVFFALNEDTFIYPHDETGFGFFGKPNSADFRKITNHIKKQGSMPGYEYITEEWQQSIQTISA